MTLIYNEFDNVWLWVDAKDHNIEYSPQFDEREYAEQWLSTIKDKLVNG